MCMDHIKFECFWYVHSFHFFGPQFSTRNSFKYFIIVVIGAVWLLLLLLLLFSVGNFLRIPNQTSEMWKCDAKHEHEHHSCYATPDNHFHCRNELLHAQLAAFVDLAYQKKKRQQIQYIFQLQSEWDAGNSFYDLPDFVFPLSFISFIRYVCVWFNWVRVRVRVCVCVCEHWMGNNVYKLLECLSNSRVQRTDGKWSYSVVCVCVWYIHRNWFHIQIKVRRDLLHSLSFRLSFHRKIKLLCAAEHFVGTSWLYTVHTQIHEKGRNEGKRHANCIHTTIRFLFSFFLLRYFVNFFCSAVTRDGLTMNSSWSSLFLTWVFVVNLPETGENMLNNHCEMDIANVLDLWLTRTWIECSLWTA